MQAALWQSENLQRPIRSGGTFKSRRIHPELGDNADVNPNTTYSMRHAIESRWSIYDIQLLSESNGRHEDWDTYAGTHKEGYMGSNQRDKISSLIDRQMIAIPRLPLDQDSEISALESCSIWRSAVLLWFLPWQTSGKLCSKKRQASLRIRYRAPKIIIREETPRSALP